MPPHCSARSDCNGRNGATGAPATVPSRYPSGPRPAGTLTPHRRRCDIGSGLVCRPLTTMPLLSKQLKRFAAAAAACALAAVAVPLILGAAHSSEHEESPRSGRPYTQGSAILSETDGLRALRSPLTAPPVMLGDSLEPGSPRNGGVETNTVVEHPNLPPSPIATSDVLIEPKQDFRRTVAPGVPLACDRYRTQVQDAGDWDPDVVLALVWRESLCNERAVSATNDWGLLQLNATCWAGKGIDGLSPVRDMPDKFSAIELQCDGITSATPAAQWCFHAKEEARRTGRRPASPCDAWLDPNTNLRAAYEIWRVRGWQPWCFDEASQSTPACRAASRAPSSPQATH